VAVYEAMPRKAGLRLTLIAAMLLAGAAACGRTSGQPVSAQDCQATGTTAASATLVAQASPSDSTIHAVWDRGIQAKAGQPFQFRLIMDARKASHQMQMRAVREGTGQTLAATIEGSVAGQVADFPARVTFPTSGCWSADFSSGTGGGEIVFKVQ
jgi:hypothetical protein